MLQPTARPPRVDNIPRAALMIHLSLLFFASCSGDSDGDEDAEDADADADANAEVEKAIAQYAEDMEKHRASAGYDAGATAVCLIGA